VKNAVWGVWWGAKERAGVVEGGSTFTGRTVGWGGCSLVLLLLLPLEVLLPTALLVPLLAVMLAALLV
jgi:hypothetical protein